VQSVFHRSVARNTWSRRGELVRAFLNAFFRIPSAHGVSPSLSGVAFADTAPEDVTPEGFLPTAFGTDRMAVLVDAKPRLRCPERGHAGTSVASEPCWPRHFGRTKSFGNVYLRGATTVRLGTGAE